MEHTSVSSITILNNTSTEQQLLHWTCCLSHSI